MKERTPSPDRITRLQPPNGVEPFDTEERYRKLVEFSPDAIAIHCEGRLVFANAAAAAMLGASSADDLIGRSLLDFVHPDFHEVVRGRATKEVEEGEYVPVLEERFVRLDGSVIDVEVAGMPFVWNGRSAAQVVVRDVTERKRAEAALRRQNEYLEVLHQTTLGLINRLELSDLLEAIVGRAASLAGTADGYMYLFDAESGDLVVQVGLGVFAEFVGFRLTPGEGVAGRVFVSGEPMVVADYDRWPGRAATFPTGILNVALGVPLKSGGNVVGIIGLTKPEAGTTFTDQEVTLLIRFAELASLALDNARLYDEARSELEERQRVERALRASEEQLRAAEAKFRTLVEQIPAMTYIDELDPEVPGGYRTTYISPQIEPMLGYSAEEFMATPGLWLALLHHDDRERAQRRLGEFLATGTDFSQEYRLVGRSGRVVWVLDAARLIRDEEGRPRFAQGVVYDITEQKSAEARLERALEREREASRRLRAVDEMKNTFLHAVSHELRTPLSAVLGVAVTLQRQEATLSPEATRELVGRLASNARKLNGLLSDLLDLDRLDRGIVEPRRRLVDLADLIRRTVAGSEMAPTREISVDADPIEIAVDPPKIERIVENLLANAARHTPEGTRIWVTARAQDTGALIAVEDEGEGVPPDLRAAVFEPFRQGPQPSRHSPGVGIGLSLVARFAELHGGRAWIEERQGGGASFQVFLPFADDAGYPFSTGAPTSEPYSVHEPS